MPNTRKTGKSPQRADRTALEDRLAAILNHAADAILVADERGVIEDCNHAAERLFGWSGEELRGQRLEVLMGDSDRDAHQGHIERYKTTGRSGILNVGPRPLTARRRDGVLVPIELSVGEATIGGERKFIGACRDITERVIREAALRRSVKELRASADSLEHARQECETAAQTAEAAKAEAEAANLAKSRFLANMSHEIRTPLNGVIAVADVLAGRIQEGADRELVEIICESGRTLLALLNDILDLAKLEASAAKLEPTSFQVGDLLDSVAAAWRCAASAKDLELTVDVGPIPAVYSDERRLRQVVSNLLSNAIKFTASGSVTIKGRHTGVHNGRARVELIVEDTGSGFDPKLTDAVFRPFQQADSSSTRQHGGTGLGLAICREIVELLGGDIRAETAPGVGTRMTIRLCLPLAEEASLQPEGATATATSQIDPVAESGPHVLVAEDHPLNRRIIAVLLDGLGATYELVEDGQAAVEAVGLRPFDLVLMDVQMPRLDGMEATRAIRRIAGPAARIPVVAVTASAMAEQVAACRAAGMDDVLTKPIQPDRLQQTLARCLAHAASQHGASAAR